MSPKSKPSAARSSQSAPAESADQSDAESNRLDPRAKVSGFFSNSTIGLAVLTSALLWFSFPPFGSWLIAWIAPVPLLYLVSKSTLNGWRPHLSVWLSGLIYWLATFYFVPLPHPALWIGWFVVSSYLACYTLLFFCSARVMVHRWRMPLVLSAPMAWTGIEWIRCNFLGGMGLVCLSHSQYEQTVLIQCADLFGAYTLTFAIVLFATSLLYLPVLTQLFPRRTHLGVAFGGAMLLAAVVGYGLFQLGHETNSESERSLTIGLIQGSVDTRLGYRESVQMEKFEQYSNLTIAAIEQWPELELVVWPESGLMVLDMLPDADESQMEPGTKAEYALAMRRTWAYATGAGIVRSDPIPMVVGTGSTDFSERFYNSAIMIDATGSVTGRYFKNQRVMYGEYFPVLNWIPALDDRLPGIDAGTEAVVFEINGLRLAPLICFETTVPHFVRRQLNRLRELGEEPDAIVNLTNDGWFFGTSCLDFHLACNVFRAVEMRKPNLVCANTGFSAEIDSSGTIIQVGPRRDIKALKVVLLPDKRTSLYRSIGDGLPMLLAGLVLAACVAGWWSTRRPSDS